MGGPSPRDPTGSTNSMAIMVEYDKDTPNFEEEPDKVISHLSKMNQPGEWKNQDMGNGSVMIQLKLQSKGHLRMQLKIQLLK